VKKAMWNEFENRNKNIYMDIITTLLSIPLVFLYATSLLILVMSSFSASMLKKLRAIINRNKKKPSLKG
jgi:hypothetical protein